jgi:hypothetical protein
LEALTGRGYGLLVGSYHTGGEGYLGRNSLESNLSLGGMAFLG